MEVDPARAAATVEYKGKTYYIFFRAKGGSPDRSTEVFDPYRCRLKARLTLNRAVLCHSVALSMTEGVLDRRSLKCKQAVMSSEEPGVK